MTLFDYRLKNQTKRLWYAARVYNNSKNAYAFATRHERDGFVLRCNKDPDFSACVLSRAEAFRLTDYKNPVTDVMLIDNHNKLCCVCL